jgi:dTDP-glucose pyrophosphorylase
MANIDKHIIHYRETLATALKMLNDLGEDLTLFVVNDNQQLMGTLTDGDVRRGLLGGLKIEDEVTRYMRDQFRYIHKNDYKVTDITKAKELGIQILPVVDSEKRIVRLINFSAHKSYLPLDAVIMAGGEGMRLRPLTETLPKPLLKVGSKPIMEHGIDRLIQFGVENINVSINYMGDKLIEHFGDGSSKGISIGYVRETEKLGTIGSLSLIENFSNDHILVMNSDLLTNIDFEEFFNEYESKDADMAVACIPYTVNIPYAIMDTDHENVLGLKEKPTLTYYSNAGIYLIRKKHLGRIPKGKFFNATDLIDNLIADHRKVTYYPILGYWLDIGKMDDFNKAQEDIKHIKF